MSALPQIFGVAGEGDTGIVDYALVNRRRDDGVEFPGDGAIDRAIHEPEHITRVGRVQAARDAGSAERVMLDGERTGLVPSGPRSVSAHFHSQADQARALGQQIAIRKTDQLARQLAPGDGETQLRPDTGWLTRRERNAWQYRAQSLYST